MRTEEYLHLPYHQEQLEWETDKGKNLKIDMVIHPNSSGRVIINYPGLGGDIDGFNEKHKKLAQYMQSEGLGAVIRIYGPGHPDFKGVRYDAALRKTIDFALENASVISNAQKPEILLIGTSAGAGAVAAVAAEYEIVSRILLMAPGYNTGKKIIRKNLSKFSGEIYIVIGANDDNVGADAGKTFFDLAINANRRELFIIPECDHNFSGTTNGRIMSQAPFYAFSKDSKPAFPDPKGGIVLY